MLKRPIFTLSTKSSFILSSEALQKASHLQVHLPLIQQSPCPEKHVCLCLELCMCPSSFLKQVISLLSRLNRMAQIYKKTLSFFFLPCNTCDPSLSGWLQQHAELWTTWAEQSCWDTLAEMTSLTTMHYGPIRSFLFLLQMENACHQHLPLFTWNTGALKDRISSITSPRMHPEVTSPTHLLLLAPLFPGQEHQTYPSDAKLRLMVFSELFRTVL